MEVSGRNVGSTGNITRGLSCDPCLILNKNEKAEYYCSECDEFFCNNCSSAHKLFRITRNHKLLSADKIPRQKLKAEENVCSKHRGQSLEYYCKIHKDFICTVCLTVEHEKCLKERIDDISPDYEKSLEYRSLTEKISGLLQQLKDIRMTLTNSSQDLQTMYTEFVSDVKTFREKINNLLDSMETKILKEAQDMKEFDMKAIQTASTACDTVTADVSDIVTNLEKQKQYKQLRHLVISAKKAEAQICEYEKELAGISSQNKVTNYKFQKNEKLLHSIQLMNNIGTLVDSGQDGENMYMEIKEPENLREDYKGPKFLSAMYVGQINVKHTGDTLDCLISGSVMLNPNIIALTDWNNYSVKLVRVRSQNIISYRKLSTQPCDVCCVNENQLVITSENRLLFVEAGQTLIVKKELLVDGACRGIISEYNKLFVTFVSPEPSVKLISLHGETLKTFSTDQNGQPLFKSPLYICMNNSKTAMFVSDPNTNRVTSLDLGGRVQNVYRDTNMKSPCGLTVDKYDQIFIAGRDSHNIHQISTQCRPIQILLEQNQGTEYPRSMLSCKIENKLYISHSFESNKLNFLSVYQLQERN